jgi:hypothetical protein
MLKVRFFRTQFFDVEPIQPGGNVPAAELYPGADGMVDYECEWEGSAADHKFHVQQPFARAGSFRAANGQHIWAWDGNREAPTLSPSFKAEFGADGPEIHIHFQQGRIVDSGSRDVAYLPA